MQAFRFDFYNQLKSVNLKLIVMFYEYIIELSRKLACKAFLLSKYLGSWFILFWRNINLSLNEQIVF